MIANEYTDVLCGDVELVSKLRGQGIAAQLRMPQQFRASSFGISTPLVRNAATLVPRALPGKPE